MKFHCPAVGLPVEVSVNSTDSPATGEDGVNPKAAVTGVATMTVRLALLEPELFVAGSGTVFDPTVE